MCICNMCAFNLVLYTSTCRLYAKLTVRHLLTNADSVSLTPLFSFKYRTIHKFTLSPMFTLFSFFLLLTGEVRKCESRYRIIPGLLYCF